VINAGEEFQKCLDEIKGLREKLLFGQGFARGFRLGCECAKEDVTEALELLAKGKLSEEIEKLKREARKEAG